MNLKPWDTIKSCCAADAYKQDRWIFFTLKEEGSDRMFVLRWHFFPYLASAWIAAYIIMVML